MLYYLADDINLSLNSTSVITTIKVRICINIRRLVTSASDKWEGSEEKRHE